MMHNRIFLALILLCANSTSSYAKAEEKLARRAMREGSFTIQANDLSYPDDLIAAFSKQYPSIKVVRKTFPAVGSEFRDLFEHAKLMDRVDVLFSCQHPVLLQFKKEGLLQNLESLPNWPQRPEHFGNENYLIYLVGSPHVLVYNSDQIKEADLPTSYDGLLDPKWRGKVILRDPTKGNAGEYFTSYIYNRKGNLDWFHQMGENHVAVGRGYDIPALVNQGTYSIGLTRDVEVLTLIKKLHDKMEKLQIKFFDDGLPFQYQFAMMNKRAPHPNAAKLFLSWLISDGQAVLEKEGYSAGQKRDRLVHGKNTWRITTEDEGKNLPALVQKSLEELQAGGAVMVKMDDFPELKRTIQPLLGRPGLTLAP